jgi:hypothetical protein
MAFNKILFNHSLKDKENEHEKYYIINNCSVFDWRYD